MCSSAPQQRHLELPAALTCPFLRVSSHHSVHAFSLRTKASCARSVVGSRAGLQPINSSFLWDFCVPYHLPNARTVNGVFVMPHGRKQTVPQMGMPDGASPEDELGVPRAAEDNLAFKGTNGLKGVPLKAECAAEAQRGLAKALCKVGLSEKDSLSVASRAPITVQHLINAGLELDEYSTWMAEQPSSRMELEQKVFELVVDNPSRQFAALIESIGVDERKISRMCHFLVNQRIAEVLQKIRSLEDALSNEEDESISIRIRRMMRETSLNTDRGLQRTLSFFEKMEAKRGGISILNVPRDAMPHIVEEFPEILVRNFDPGFKELLSYFEEIGVPKQKVASLVMCFPSVLLYNSVEELRRRLRVLKKDASVRPRNFGEMVVKYPWILSGGFESNVHSLTAFLKALKVPLGKVGSCITKCPNLLGCSTVTMETTVQQLMATGIKRVALGKVLSNYPQLLIKKPKDFNEIVAFLKSWGLDESDMLKILMRCPPVFASSKTYLQMKITFLLQLGIHNQCIEHVLRQFPEYLMLSLQNSLQPRISFLRGLGLSNGDIAFMICGFPPILGYSIDRVLKPKLDVLKNVICHPIKEVVLYPRYFSYCLERKIIPRFRILKRANVEWDLKSMLSPSDDQFAQDYLGVGHMIVPPVRLQQI